MVSTRLSIRSLVRIGLLAGLAGGLAEVCVVEAYMALTGGNPAVVGRGIAAAVGLGGASAWAGLVIHMGLAIALGAGLCLVFDAVRGLHVRSRPLRFMVASLAAVWAINFFGLLPILSPEFVHVLPYAVTLASKLAFGLAAAAVMQVLASADVSPFAQRQRPTILIAAGR